MRIFEITKSFSPEEKFSLIDQIRRASRSVCLKPGGKGSIRLFLKKGMFEESKKLEEKKVVTSKEKMRGSQFSYPLQRSPSDSSSQLPVKN